MVEVVTHEQIIEMIVRWIAEQEIRDYPGTLYGDHLRSLLWLLDGEKTTPSKQTEHLLHEEGDAQ